MENYQSTLWVFFVSPSTKAIPSLKFLNKYVYYIFLYIVIQWTQSQRKSIWGEMASSEALQAAKVYRNLLKSVKKHIGTEEHKVHFTDFIKQEFQKSRQQIDPSLIQHKVKLARDFTILLNSVHHHKVLLCVRVCMCMYTCVYFCGLMVCSLF